MKTRNLIIAGLWILLGIFMAGVANEIYMYKLPLKEALWYSLRGCFFFVCVALPLILGFVKLIRYDQP